MCGQAAGERNYHIFYQLCSGLPESLWQKLKLSSPDQFHYLNRGCTQYLGSKEIQINDNRKSAAQKKHGSIRDIIVDDVKDFEFTDKALKHFGVNDTDRLAIYQIVAAILHLGNVVFEDSPEDSRGGCRVQGNLKSY